MKTLLVLALLILARAVAASGHGLPLVPPEPTAFTFVSDGPLGCDGTYVARLIQHAGGTLPESLRRK